MNLRRLQKYWLKHWVTSRFQPKRRMRCWQPLRLTRTKLLRAISTRANKLNVTVLIINSVDAERMMRTFWREKSNCCFEQTSAEVAKLLTEELPSEEMIHEPTTR